MSEQARDLAFPVAEYRQRLAVLHEGMAARGLDAALVLGPENLFHLTGFETIGYSAFQRAAVPAGADPRLLVRELERGAARRLSWMETESDTIQDGADPIDSVVALLQRLGLATGRLGIDRSSWFLTANQYLALTERLPDATVVDGSGPAERARRVQSPLEVECIRRAARHTEAGGAAGHRAVP